MAVTSKEEILQLEYRSSSILSFFFFILIVNLNRRSIDTFHKQHN